MFDPDYTTTLANEVANRPLYLVIIETGLLVVIVLTALIGNSCVMYVFYKTPRLRTVTSYYIIALALSDIAQSVLMMPIAIAISACGRDVIGHTLGQIKGFICLSLVAGTLLTIALISINRYFCVAQPKIYKKIFKNKTALLMLIGVWISVVCLTGFLVLMGWMKFDYFPGMHLYFVVFTRKLRFALLVLYVVIFIVFPFSSTALCYWKIYKAIKNHNTNVSSTFMNQNANTWSLSKEEISISLSLLALVIGFVLCWIPAIIIYSLEFFMNIPRFVELISMYTVYISSAINPILYNIFNQPFRKEFFALFSKCSAEKRVSPSDIEISGKNNR